MLPIWCAYVCTLSVSFCVAGTNNPPRNAVAPETDWDSITSHFPWYDSVRTNTLSERLEFHLQQKLISVPRRSVHPFNTMVRLLTPDNTPEFEAHRARIGIALTRDVTVYTFREVVRDSLLLQHITDANTFIGGFVRDSVGNTDEEILGSKKTPYVQDESGLWKSVVGARNVSDTNLVSARYSRLAGTIHPRYGLRWNYAYTTLAIGRNKYQPLAFLDTRFYYGDVALGDITGSHAEVLLGIPVGLNTSLTVSCTQEVDLSDWDNRIQLRLNHRLDGIHMFTGVALRKHNQHEEIRYLFGLEKRW